MPMSVHYCRLIAVTIIKINIIIIINLIIAIIYNFFLLSMLRDTYTCRHHRKLKETISTVIALFYKIRRNEIKYFYKYDLNMHIYLLAVNFTFNLYFPTHTSKIRNHFEVDFDTFMIFTLATQV